MGYEMYRMLTSKRVSAPSRSRKSKKVEVIDIEEEERAKELLQGKACYLFNITSNIPKTHQKATSLSTAVTTA